MAQYFIDSTAAPIDFELNSTEPLKRTLQNVKNLLRTRMGEVPFDRFRGFDVRLFDLPLKKMNEELVPELDRLMMWEPDVEVVSAKARLDRNGNTVIEAVVECGL